MSPNKTKLGTVSFSVDPVVKSYGNSDLIFICENSLCLKYIYTYKCHKIKIN